MAEIGFSLLLGEMRKHQVLQSPAERRVEIDKTFIGGKKKNKYGNKCAERRSRSRGARLLCSALERNGEFRASQIHSLKGVKEAVRSHVADGSIVPTDGYSGLGTDYYYQAVNHSSGEYSRGYCFTLATTCQK